MMIRRPLFPEQLTQIETDCCCCCFDGLSSILSHSGWMQYWCNNVQRSRAPPPRELIMEIWPQQQQPHSRTRSLPHVTFRGGLQPRRNEHRCIRGSIKTPLKRLRTLPRYRSPRLSSRPPRCFSVGPSALLSPILNFPSGHRFFFLLSSSSRIFLWSSLESILLNSCHTERFCSLSRASGEMLCQAERKEEAAVSLQAC